MPNREISRRSALGVLAGAGLGASGALGAAAEAEPRRRERRRRARTIMLIRHGEKPDDNGVPPGVTPASEHDLESLTVRGWTRAGAVVGLFAPPRHHLRRGIARPGTLFASDPGQLGSKRPLQTITPLAERLGKTVELMPIDDEEPDAAAIAARLAATRGVSLGSWQHRMIPLIARGLGNVHPQVPHKWPEDRYDVVWLFTRRANGSWRFTQVPQLLLAGDLRSVIT